MAAEKDTPTVIEAAHAVPKPEDKSREAADKGREASARTADASRRSAEAGAESVRRSADAGAEATRRTADAGANAARQGAEAFRDSARETANSAFSAAQQTTEQFQRLFGLNRGASDGAYRNAQRDMEKVFEASTVLMDGFQSAWKDWLDLSQDALKRHVDGVNAMMRCRNVQDLYATQSELVRDEFRLWLDAAGKVTRKAADTTNHAARALKEADESARQKVY